MYGSPTFSSFSIKSFKFKILKSQMLSHEYVQKNKIQGETEKRGKIQVLHITQAQLSCTMFHGPSLTQQTQNLTWRSTSNFGVGAYLKMKKTLASNCHSPRYTAIH